MQTIGSLLEKLDQKYKLADNASTDHSALNSERTTDEALDHYQEKLGFEFSSSLRKLYKLANGTSPSADDNEVKLFLSHAFNPIEKAVSIHQELVEFSKSGRQSEYDDTLQGKLYSDYYFNFKLGAIKHQEFHPHWFPLGSIQGMSTYIIVDHSPGDTGVHGQVIFIDLGRKAIVLADTLELYLEKLVKHTKYILKQEDDYKVMFRVATDSIWRSMLY